MSLTNALKNRTPLVWVDTTEPERVIGIIPTLSSEKSIFLFDDISGLTQWHALSKEWKIVLTSVKDPNTEEMVDTSLNVFGLAFMYFMEQSNSILIKRNAHMDLEGFFSILSSMFGKYRASFLQDNIDKTPNQVVLLATGKPCPPELRSMTTTVHYGLPGRSEIAALINHIQSNRPEDLLQEQDLSLLISSSLGMSELEIIETYLDLIRANKVIEATAVQKIKFDRIKQNSILDIIKPKVSLADVGGLDGAKKLISEAEWIWRNPDKAQEFGLTPISRILFLGLPGCGKSYICEAAANTLGLDLARTGISKAMNKFIGESESQIQQIFDQINALAPIAVWMDELGRELSGSGSSEYTDGGTTSRVHGIFLTAMQELKDGVFLFAAANNIDTLPPEMLRAGRFDKILFVGFPSFEERKDIFKLNLIGPNTYDLDLLSSHTACFSGSEIKKLLEIVRSSVSVQELRHITTEDILQYIPLQKNRLWIRHKALVVSSYERALNEYEWASEAQRQEAGYIAQGKHPAGSAALATASKMVLK